MNIQNNLYQLCSSSHSLDPGSNNIITDRFDISNFLNLINLAKTSIHNKENGD